jgi:lipid-A-disaccharide synthase
MISCGEASGDLYAGALVDALREIDPGVEVFGFGGERLRAAGADLIGDIAAFP